MHRTCHVFVDPVTRELTFCSARETRGLGIALEVVKLKVIWLPIPAHLLPRYWLLETMDRDVISGLRGYSLHRQEETKR